MALSLQQFVQRWKLNSLSERSGSQSHFIDLCDMLGEPHPAAADAVGERYTFEKPVPKTYGGKGFADVWLRDHVKPLRDTNRDSYMRQNWWRHGRSRPTFRKAVASLSRYIATAEVSKYRLFIWTDSAVVPDHSCHVIARADDFFFGLLHSLAHEVWSLGIGSTLEDRPRYTSDSTFDTFPFPWPPSTEPSEADSPIVKAIADAARELVRLRDVWLNPPGILEADLKGKTLTKLYNQRPTWLSNAHHTLDRAVFAAYRWPEDPADLPKQEILARLLALNHERAAAQPPKGRHDRPTAKPKRGAPSSARSHHA